MKLKRLRLQQIRSYDSAELEFEDGTTLIAGDVGSGKTSLLYALEMALFGFAEVEPAFLIRHQAVEAEVALTLYDEGHEYELRRRFRRRTRKGRDVFEPEENSYAVDGQRTTYSTTELRQRAIDLLGFPDNPNPRAHSDLWRWAVYIPQERMREVLQQDPQERLETVRKALGLEQYRTAAENSQLVAAEIRRRGEAKLELARRLSHWGESLPTLVARTTELRASLEEAQGRMTEARDELGTAETRYTDLDSRVRAGESEQQEAGLLREESVRDRRESEELRVRVAAHLAEVARLRADLVETDRSLERLQPVRGERETLVLDRGRLREAGSRAEELQRRLAAERALVESTQRARVELSREAERAEAERRQRSAEVAELGTERPTHAPPAPSPRTVEQIDEATQLVRQRAEALEREVVRLGRDVEELDHLIAEGVCPRCHQKVEAESFGRHREELSVALREATDKRDTTQREEQALGEERRARERFDRAWERWLDVERRRASAREVLARAEGRGKEMHELTRRAEGEMSARSQRVADLEVQLAPQAEQLRRLTEIEARLEAVDRDLAALDRQVIERRAAQERSELLASEALRIEERLGELTARQDSRRARLDRLAEQLPIVESTRSEAHSLKSRLAELRRRVEEGAASVARLESERRSTALRLAEAEAGERERLGLQAEAARFERLQRWLAGPFETTVLDVERRLLQQARQEFDRAFSRYFATLIEDPSLVARSDPQFSPMVEAEGEWTPAEALSGGERTALALAFRLALGHVVRGLGRLKLETMILDEPTDGFSPEQVVRMGELLGELALPQVILVSHEAQLAGIADRVVRVTKVDGRSQLDAGTRAITEPVPPGRAPPKPPVAPRRRGPRARRTLDGIPAP